MRVVLSGKTDIGRQRDLNEDALLLLPEFSLMAVADGLGGHRSGRVASQLAISTLHDFFVITVRPDATWPFPYDDKLSDEENYLFTGIRLANRRIFDRALKTLVDFGMGTTCAAGMFAPDLSHYAVAHVGDSRGSLLRDGQLTTLTRDHSLVSDAIQAAPWMTAEEIAQLPKNVITRALGIREEVQIDVQRVRTQPGDLFLLCTDGLTAQVSDAEVLEIVREAALDGSQERLDACVETLIARANASGGLDNVTVTLAQLVED